MSLKERAISGLLWSFIDKFSGQVFTFIAGIILARLLSPKDFGLVGMLAIFITVSAIFVQSGFNQALIRKKDCGDEDYSTAFFFNVIVSIFFYFLLFLFSGGISQFYEEPVLKPLIQVLGLGIVINALTSVQRTKVIKEIDFKVLTKISLASTIGSGIIGIVMALSGFGVWSLVYKTLAQYIISGLLLWKLSKWNPIFTFSQKSFKEMFSFGGRLMVLGLIDTVYQNIYFLIIGKYYSAAQLGQYTRAESFKDLPVKSLAGIIESVSYPVLSQIQNDPLNLKNVYRRLIKSSMLIILILMFGLSAIAQDLTILILGIEWSKAGEYLQILCFAGVFYPLHSLNANILKVKGRSDIILNLGIIKKILAVPVVLLAIFVGIKSMLIAMVFHQFLAFCLNSYWGGKEIGYGTTSQIKDILPSFFVALLVYIVLSLGDFFLELELIYKVSVLIFSGALVAFAILELTSLENYIYIKSIIRGKYKKKGRVNS